MQPRWSGWSPAPHALRPHSRHWRGCFTLSVRSLCRVRIGKIILGGGGRCCTTPRGVTIRLARSPLVITFSDWRWAAAASGPTLPSAAFTGHRSYRGISCRQRRCGSMGEDDRILSKNDLLAAILILLQIGKPCGMVEIFLAALWHSEIGPFGLRNREQIPPEMIPVVFGTAHLQDRMS